MSPSPRSTVWTVPDDATSDERVLVGPFVTREVVHRPDGTVLVYTSRRHRKGLGPMVQRPDGTRPSHERVLWAPHRLGWWIAVLFMIGSACFAVGATPAISNVLSGDVIDVIFFVGSLFFTSAGYCQYVEAINADRPEGTPRRYFAWQPTQIDWWATFVQSLGTLCFNVSTFAAMRHGFTTHQENVHVWAPDFFGSIGFLVASSFAWVEVCHRVWAVETDDLSWRIVALNLLGSVFFMASAVAAVIVPSSGTALDVSIANSGTFLGAVCFFWGAKLLLDEMASGD